MLISVLLLVVEFNILSACEVSCVVELVKRYLLELPTPVIPTSMYDMFIEAAGKLKQFCVIISCRETINYLTVIYFSGFFSSLLFADFYLLILPRGFKKLRKCDKSPSA